MITVPTVGTDNGFTATQKYYYDSLSRIDDSTEEIASSQTWRQDFDYDRYGNRNFVEGNTTFDGFEKLCNGNTELCSELRKILNPSVNTADNRLSSSDGYIFDAAGNTSRDPQLRKFTYDAENKQVKVETVDSGGTVTGTIGEYVYDGDGKRIKKIVPGTGEVTVFVYDAGGKLVAEYATEISPDPKVSYTTADHLGSPRILTDENGSTISRRDFHPFGEEILTTHRHPDLGYTPDDVRKKFTTYERDTETDLDFAQARYFNPRFGRFSTADDFFNDSNVADPPSWNKYVYGRNNPLKFSDRSGKTATVEVSIDEKKKTGVIRIKATIGIWTTSRNISSKQMQKAASAIQANINGTWKGSFIKDGITYTVETNVTVSVRDSHFDARAKGDMNVIEMQKGPINSPGGTVGAESGPHEFFTGRDKGRWNIDQIGINRNLPAHEFGHLLGIDDKPGHVLMNTEPRDRHPSLTAEDFDWGFGSTVTAQRKESMYDTVTIDTVRGWRTQRVNRGTPRNSSKSYRMSVPSLRTWWKSK